MRWLYSMLFFCSSLLFAQSEESFSITGEQADRIAQKIWNNECKGTIEGLTTWRKGENFASLGIGHFIWYPKNHKDGFDETFPSLLIFIQKNGYPIPDVLVKSRGCPWTSKEDFDSHLNSPDMQSVRTFLVETKKLQALFIARRLEKSFPLVLVSAPEKDRSKIKAAFSALAQNERGLYVLLDYVNFKGLGLLPGERYAGEGWGLLQVLSRMPDPIAEDPVTDFATSAKQILKERVQHAPKEQKILEEQWLKGWLNRIDTYTE